MRRDEGETALERLFKAFFKVIFWWIVEVGVLLWIG